MTDNNLVMARDMMQGMTTVCLGIKNLRLFSPPSVDASILKQTTIYEKANRWC